METPQYLLDRGFDFNDYPFAKAAVIHIVGAKKVLFVVVDSTRPGRGIPDYIFNDALFAFDLSRSRDFVVGKPRILKSILVDYRKYAFVVLDIGSGRQRTKRLVENRSRENISRRVYETITDIVSNPASLFTLDRANIRLIQLGGGGETTNSKLIDVDITGSGDLKCGFLAPATPNEPWETEEVSNSGKKSTNSSDTYEVYLLYDNFLEENIGAGVEDINAWLLETTPLIHCNCPAYKFQGFQYNATRRGLAIKPLNTAPKEWDAVHGDAVLCKHLTLILGIKDRNFGTYRFFIRQIAQKALSQLYGYEELL